MMAEKKKPKLKEEEPPRRMPHKFFRDLFGLSGRKPRIQDLIDDAQGLELPWKVLGFDDAVEKGVAEKAYKKLSLKYHPDRGGDPKKMAELNEAWTRIKKEMNW